MINLLSAVKITTNKHKDLPFSVYTSLREQKLLDVPIIKPLLIIVLSGEKKLGANHELTCNTGSFIFLPNRSSINMRNIPKNKEYFALLIEFDHKDFNGLQVTSLSQQDHVTGSVSPTLATCLNSL